MKISRVILRFAALTAALLSGTLFTACPMYGIDGGFVQPPLPPLPHDPTVHITDFSYAPASPLRSGVEITFTVKLNKPTDAGGVYVTTGALPGAVFSDINDNGYHADAVAGDGIYTGVDVWEEWLIGVVDTPVTAHLWWEDRYPEQMMGAAPLTIISPEGQI